MPNTLAKYGEHLYPINRWGFRHEDFPKEKPAGEFRVFVLGDSIVFGQGTAHGDFSEALGKRLAGYRRPDGRRWRVINTGVPSYTTCQELALLEGFIEPFSPDLVIVGYAMNDPEKPRAPFGLDVKTGAIAFWWRTYHFFKQRLALPKYVMAKLSPLVARLRGHTYYGPPVDPKQEVRYVETLHDPSGEYWKAAEACLRGFGEYQRRAHVPVVLGIFPLLRFMDSKELGRVHAQVAESGKAAGLEVVDLRPVFAALQPGRLARLQGDGMHPTEEGHGVAAEAVYARLSKQVRLLAGRGR